MLAGILKNPSKYSPVASVENATKRRNVVLSLMKNQNLITDAEYNSAKNEKISVDLNAIYSNTQSYVESATFEAAGILNVSVGGVLSGGYKIETFLNPDYQACLTEVLGNPNFYVLNKNGVRADGLSIIVDNKNMGVSAYFQQKTQYLRFLSTFRFNGKARCHIRARYSRKRRVPCDARSRYENRLQRIYAEKL